MSQVNMLEAKTNLSRLVDAVESGAEKEIIIARNGKPAARLVPVGRRPDTSRRIGLAAGKFAPISLEDFNSNEEEVARLFYGEPE